MRRLYHRGSDLPTSRPFVRRLIRIHSPRRFSAALLVLAATVVALSTGCGGRRTVLPVTIDEKAPTTMPTAVGVMMTHEAAVRGISAILVRELGLTVPSQVTVFVYSSRDVFQRGLVEDAHVSPVRAAELSDFAVGIGRSRQLLLNEEGAHPRGREWLRLIAHELTHVAQIELAQGEGKTEQWLAEGMAEWAAFTVLERLGLDSVDRRRAWAASLVRSHPALRRGRVDLVTLGSPRGFTIRHLREGSLATYQLSFLMADYLIAREGMPKVVDYFRASGRSPHRADNFKKVFGQTLDEFEAEVLPYLEAIAR
jgi:hypothetical protein